MKAVLLVTVALLAASPAAGVAPGDFAEPQPDSLYAERVREYTTDPRFLPEAVAQLPASSLCPSPAEFLGYVIGAPNKLTYYTEIKAYFETIADASPRMVVRSMGKSNEGREMIVAFIADQTAIASLDTYLDATRRLADPRITDERAAREIISRARPIYYLTGGLHSNETGSPEMLMELAYRLVTGESPAVKRIRERVITMITPVLETDGRERMVDWYYNVTADHGSWTDMPQRYPPYWGKYILHDNNRDGLQLTQPLTRHLFDTFFETHPQVMHDLHESVPFLYVSAGTGPYNNALDPIVTSEWQQIANHEVSELTRMGLPGVWTWGFYTGWWPGYLMWLANNHNAIGRFYETFGNAGASTFERELKSRFAGKEVTSKSWYRPWPPEKEVTWSMRNTINYMETGVLVALEHTAANGASLLDGFWRKGANSLGRGRTEAPYAWIIPRENQTRFELSHLLRALAAQRIEIHQLTEKLQLGVTDFQAGDYVVRADQPYRDFAKSLFEEQHFPEDAEFPPYDDVAWTLPLLYGVDVAPIDTPDIFDAPMTLVDRPEGPRADAPRERSAYILPATSSSVWLAARIRLGTFSVFAADTSFSHRGVNYPRGSWLVSASGSNEKDLHTAVSGIASDLGLTVDAVRTLPTVPAHELDIPRIAVFHTWVYTQDSGWVRYTFDTAGIPYTLINKDDLRDGGLRDLYDVVLIPSTGSFVSARDVVHGIDTRWGPIPYRRDASSTNLGRIDSSDDITGGMGFAGLSELMRFVEGGGTLITLGAASALPVEFGMIRHVDRVRPDGFANPGSVVRARVANTGHPIAYGYDEFPMLFRGNLPLFKVDDTHKHYAVVTYGTKPLEEEEDGSGETDGDTAANEPLCVSGMVKGPEHLDGKPAILDVASGDGRVILFSFNPLHRYLNLSNFAFVNNAILHWND